MMQNTPHDAKCGAKTRAGTPCQQPAGWGTNHVGNGRCKLHGGKSLAGVASGTFKNGRHSKFLPTRLSEHYEAAVKDSELLELRQEIALVDARLTDLLKRVDTGESGKLWTDTLSAWVDFKSATREKDRDKQQEYAARLDSLINQGHADYRAWSEIQTILEQRRRLVESERKRLVDMQQYITSQQAMTLVAAMIGIIKENVTDRDTLQSISTAVNGLVAANHS